MKSFLRDNPTIAFGLGLPLLLVVAFLLISGIPALLVAPPQFDVLYATDYYGYPGGIQISVVNEKVQVNLHGNPQGYPQPRLWRYNSKTGGVKEIAIILPPGLDPSGKPSVVPGTTTAAETSKITPIDVPDLAGLTVNSSNIAPDGYEFNAGENRYSGDIFTGLFGYSRYRNEAVLTKNGRSIHLPNADERNYYNFSTRFVGWIVTP
jgi:hypothetical protein